jgi:tetratricopeptide (TPR) repeat protein
MDLQGRRTLFLALIFACSLVGFAHVAQAADDRRELEGRALFAKGEYSQALDVFARLFAEKGDPVYLRNIGRCYQKLRQPEKAIDSFREYLRRSRVKPREREEIDGFIREMQELQATQAATTPPAPTEPAPPARSDTAPSNAGGSTPAHAPAMPPPAITAPPARAATDGSPTLITIRNENPPAAAPTDDSLLYRWWFWAGVGAVVAGGVAAAIVLGGGSSGSERPNCPGSVICPL